MRLHTSIIYYTNHFARSYVSQLIQFYKQLTLTHIEYLYQFEYVTLHIVLIESILSHQWCWHIIVVISVSISGVCSTKGAFINDVIQFGPFIVPPPIVILRHLLAYPPPYDDVIKKRDDPPKSPDFRAFQAYCLASFSTLYIVQVQVQVQMYMYTVQCIQGSVKK